jgi:hypothetical protein
VTIYEVLERLIIGPVFRSDEEQAAVQVIHDLRDMNAFGTTAANVDLDTHECDPAQMYIYGVGDTRRCRICGKECA